MAGFTLEYLKSILCYDPEAGIFTWMVRKPRTDGIGSIAGCLSGNGYWVIGINGEKYGAHRLAWFYKVGRWPLVGMDIDHEDRDRSNNRFSNLREISITTAELTQEYLKSILCYDPETGIFTWIEHRQGTKGIGSEAGTLRDNGYWVIGIDGKSYGAHRLAWFYETGKWPLEDVDHEDHNKINNKFSNLRLATRSQSQWNRKGNYSDETKGTTYDRGYYIMRIMAKGIKYQSCHKTQEEAHAAYVEASRRLHGEFCYTPFREDALGTQSQ
jgi:hypothetical protein